MLVFLAADHRRLEDLQRGVAEYLAWSSVAAEAGAEGLNLDPSQARQATTKKEEGHRTVDLRLAETYQWLVVPGQADPAGAITWDIGRADGQSALVARASRKLVNDGHLYVAFPPALLRQRLDRELASLWEFGHTTVSAVWSAFARYLYLPRLQDIDVLVRCAATGPASTVWHEEAFAVADAVEDGHYLGLAAGSHAIATATTLIVHPDEARRQLGERENVIENDDEASTEGDVVEDDEQGAEDGTPGQPTRFHGVVSLDPERLSRDFGKVSHEVVSHLLALLGTDVEVTIEIAARNAEGFPDATVRNVSENAKTLKFDEFGFEER